MKIIFTLQILLIAIYSNAQVLCGTANEGGTITLTAPSGKVFISIDFASYGTPNGTCGSFTTGGCHATNSQSICSGIFVGQNSASIGANNGVFGDPCGGTPKRLYIQATYSSTLPLTLISFTAQKTGQDKVKLAWSAENEINTSHFEIERSSDGLVFGIIGLVTASGSGSNSYSFINTSLSFNASYYYRIKIMDKDGKYQYSNIVRTDNNVSSVKLSLFPNPATDFITISSNQKQEVCITNSTGLTIQNYHLISGNQTINISSWPSGIYFIKTESEVVKFIKK